MQKHGPQLYIAHGAHGEHAAAPDLCGMHMQEKCMQHELLPLPQGGQDVHERLQLRGMQEWHVPEERRYCCLRYESANHFNDIIVLIDVKSRMNKSHDCTDTAHLSAVWNCRQ